MRRRVMLIIAAILVALGIGVGVAYAATSRSFGSPSGNTSALAGPTWRLTRLEVDGKSGIPVSANRAPTISFQPKGQFNGDTSCNWYGGSYTVTGNRMKLSDMSMTLVACVGPGLTTDSDIMSFEATYVQALSRITTYQVSGDTLTLSDGSGAVMMTFKRG
jgi:heat shock protein HslJ